MTCDHDRAVAEAHRRLAEMDRREAELGRELAAVEAEAERVLPTDRLTTGAAWLDAPSHVEAVWGDPSSGEVLWARSEPLILVGPDGSGKGTLAQQLAFRRSGVHAGALLGQPIEVGPGRVLYVAADRPRQIARSARRMLSELDREALARALVVWPGPLPFDLGRQPERLAPWVEHVGDVDAVFLDSLGLLAADLIEDGSGVARGLAELVAAGIEVCALYHPRKRNQGKAARVRTVDDVYGSRWLTAAAGSIIYLDGQPGDLIVRLRHLKQPAAEVGPLTIRHDHERGITVLHESPDLLDLAASGVTVRDAASALYGVSAPSRNQGERARRRLDKLASAGRIERTPVAAGEPTLYRTVER